jgi:hypothetical protein
MNPEEFAKTPANTFKDGARSNPQGPAPSIKSRGFSPNMTNIFEDAGAF